jgi:CheY-like chemotaxis protein
MAQNGKSDIILMDLHMPDLDGIAATKQIRSLGVKIPILGLTANSDEQIRNESLKVGMKQVITKPVKGVDLKNAIETALFEANESLTAAESSKKRD